KIKSTLNLLKAIEENKPSLVYTDLIIVDDKLKIINPSMHEFYNHNHTIIKPSLIFHNIVTGCSVMLNRNLLEIALPFPSHITMHDHWLALCATFGGNVKALKEKTI